MVSICGMFAVTCCRHNLAPARKAICNISSKSHQRWYPAFLDL